MAKWYIIIRQTTVSTKCPYNIQIKRLNSSVQTSPVFCKGSISRTSQRWSSLSVCQPISLMILVQAVFYCLHLPYQILSLKQLHDKISGLGFHSLLSCTLFAHSRYQIGLCDQQRFSWYTEYLWVICLFLLSA